MATIAEKQNLITKTLKQQKAELVFKNAGVINVFSGEIYTCDVAVDGGFIAGLGNYEGIEEIDLSGKYLSPGFIDAHCHTESSMVTLDRFAGEVIPHGTTTVVCDPHEIANVKGIAGIKYIIDCAKNIPANIHVMLPSCVPSSKYETNGASLTSRELSLLADEELVAGLGEVMDLEGIFEGNAEVLKKIELFEKNKTIDGHAPLVTGQHLQACKAAGIQTDHESTEFAEALEKLRCGIHVLVREGTSERNLREIITGVVKENIPTANMAFCTDDKTIRSIRQEGHISHNIRYAIELGLRPAQAYAMATINPAKIYGFKNTGAIVPGYKADLVVLDNLEAVKVNSVYIGGICISKGTAPVKLPQTPCPEELKHTVNIKNITAEDIKYRVNSPAPVVEILKNQILTKKTTEKISTENGVFTAGATHSLAMVIERHNGTGNIGKGIVKGYGIKNGAIASTIAHDSHNLIVIGDNDTDILTAIEEIKRIGGGCTIAGGGKILKTIPLPVCGLITDDVNLDINSNLEEFHKIARNLGIPEGIDPLLHPAFIALPVIPEIRITDKGLFDVMGQVFI